MGTTSRREALFAAVMGLGAPPPTLFPPAAALHARIAREIEQNRPTKINGRPMLSPCCKPETAVPQLATPTLPALRFRS